MPRALTLARQAPGRAPRDTAQLLDAGLPQRPRRRVVRGRVTHRPFRDAIRLLLVLITGGAEHQLGLRHRRVRPAGRLAGLGHDLLHITVAVLPLQLQQRVGGAGQPTAAGLPQCRAQGRDIQRSAMANGDAENRAVTGCLAGPGFGRRGLAGWSEPGIGWDCCPATAPGHPRLPREAHKNTGLTLPYENTP
jgi:hypothetical protein